MLATPRSFARVAWPAQALQVLKVIHATPQPHRQPVINAISLGHSLRQAGLAQWIERQLVPAQPQPALRIVGFLSQSLCLSPSAREPPITRVIVGFM